LLKATGPIGFFDSGVGGLSVLREVYHQLPYEDTLYFADSIHCPYGYRTEEEIRGYVEQAVAWLIGQGSKIIVVACNTASAASLSYLRAVFDLPIVGMEPALKPAVECSQAHKVGVIATEITLKGQLFAGLLERFAQGTEVYAQACPHLAPLVEAGKLEGPETEEVLRGYLEPMLAAGIDALVLGCTHYPFLRPAIEQVVGPGVRIIDPSPAVAGQTGRVLTRQGLHTPLRRSGRHIFYTTGDSLAYEQMVRRLIGGQPQVCPAHWERGEVVAPPAE